MDMDNTGFGNDKGKGKGKGGGKGGSGGTGGGKSDTICRDFAHNGQCRFGTQCRFRHGNGGAATDTGGSVFGSPISDFRSQQGFPPQQGYPPQQGFPPQQGYPPQQGGMPQQGYPPQQGGMSQQGYSPQQGFPPQQGYPPQQGGMPQQGYPPQQGGIGGVAAAMSTAVAMPPASKGPVSDDVWSNAFEFGNIPETPPPRGKE